MSENLDININKSTQNINIPKGGDNAVKNLIEEIKERIEKEGIFNENIQSLFCIQEVTEKERVDFEKIWQEVWEREEYHDNDIEKIKRHYKEYDHNSIDLLLSVKAANKKIPIGTMRIIIGGKEGNMPAFKDFKIEEEWKEEPSAEFTLLAIKPGWRGLKHINSFLLWKEGCRQIQKRNIDNIIFIADKKLIGLFNKVGFIVYKISPEEKYYEGDICSVYCIKYNESLQNLKKYSEELYEFFKVN